MRYLMSLLLACLLNACAATTIPAPVGERGERPAHNPGFHTVRQGDSLYSIAFLYGYEVEQLAHWNNLAPPYTVYKGQRLRLTPPVRSTRHSRPNTGSPLVAINPSRPKPQQVAPSRPKTVATHHPTVPKVPSQPSAAQPPPPSPPPPQQPDNRQLAWLWPASGPLLQRYAAAGEGKKGISIGGKNGAPVSAAAPGKVVYSGSGLGGYGRLIIIKHNKDFLSAYAHNKTLIATEGQWVEQGQLIAEMGNSGTDRVQLYFEIRKQGRPVDPLDYLPRR